MKTTRFIAAALAFMLCLTGCTHYTDEVHYERQSGTYIVIKAGDYYLMGDTNFNGQNDIWSNSQDGNVNFTQIPESFDSEPLMFAEIEAAIVKETGGVDGRMEFNFDEIDSLCLLSFDEAISRIELNEQPRGSVASAYLPQIVRFTDEDEVYIFALCGDKYNVYIDGELYTQYTELGLFGDVHVNALYNSEINAETAAELVQLGEVQNTDFFALTY